ncbi:MAG: MOSC domain-containing protein [Pseudomonadota bacterium]
MEGALKAMMARHASAGRVAWIGLRPGRREPMSAVLSCELDEAGLKGDHGRAGKRAVTLLQAEHVAVIASLTRRAFDVSDLRRNILVSGINLNAIKGTAIRVGSAELELTGPCHPCSRMEEVLGPGGYNAMRGHGGMCARVLKAGSIREGDVVEPCGD